MPTAPVKTEKIHHGPFFWVMLVLGGLLLLLVSAGAQSHDFRAQAIARTYLRAGPFPDFPVVAVVQPQQWLRLQGCLQDWSWCRAEWGTVAGWTTGMDIGVDRQGWVHTTQGVYWFNGPPPVSCVFARLRAKHRYPRDEPCAAIPGAPHFPDATAGHH